MSDGEKSPPLFYCPDREGVKSTWNLWEQATIKSRKENDMENMENLVVNTAENTENTAEQTAAPKMYSQEEVDAIIGKRVARTKAKIEKDYQRKYGDLESVLKAGTGKESVEEMTDTFKNFYAAKGIKMPEKPNYSDKDIEVLAKAEADDIIRLGFDEVVDEVDRLTRKGAANMTAREKAVFKTLAEHRQNAERVNELSAIGVTEDVSNSEAFKTFSKKFNPNTPVREIYDLYAKTQPKKEIKTMGSMKNSTVADSGVKEFYSRDEALRFTKNDFDKNPALYDAVRKSMLKW